MKTMQKLSDDEYNNLYVTSDTHFGHNQEFIYKRRGYENPQVMNEDMIRIINDTVGENGILLHLGDFCLNTTRDQYNDIIRSFKIKELWMLWGNHNANVMRSYGGTRHQIAEFNGNTHIIFMHYYFTFRYKRNSFVCSHFPFRIWDDMTYGTIHLHGHCHNNLASSREDDKTNKILDVGWDAYPKPLHIKEIMKIMDTKNINSLHHA